MIRGARGGVRGGGGRGGGARGGAALPARSGPQDAAGPPHGKYGGKFDGTPPIFSPAEELQKPSADVTRKENADILANKKTSLSSLSLEDDNLPLRPAFGQRGKDIVLRTNYFEFSLDQTKEIHKYDVSISPKETIKRKCRRIFEHFLNFGRIKSLGKGVAVDYESQMLTSPRLNLGPTGSKSINIEYVDPVEGPPRKLMGETRAPRQSTMYTVTVSAAGTVQVPELLRYLLSTSEDPESKFDKTETVAALNIIAARTPNMQPDVFSVGKNKFYPYPIRLEEQCDLGGGLIAVKGFFSSVRTSTLRVLVNVNAQTSPFYPDINVRQLMLKNGHQNGDATASFLKGLRVQTRYMKHEDGTEAIRIKTIKGLARYPLPESPYGSAKEVKFQSDEYGEVTVQDYFKKKHNITLQYPDEWVLNVGTNAVFENGKETRSARAVFLPPELCKVEPGQLYKGELTRKQTSVMVKYSIRPPAENARRIVEDGLNILGLKGPGAEALAAFGIQVKPEMVTVPARILSTPVVKYPEGTETSRNASWNMIKKSFNVRAKIQRWSYLKLGDVGIGSNEINAFQKALGQYLKSALRPEPAEGYALDLNLWEERDTSDRKIQDILEKISNNKVEILLVILPDEDAFRYSRVKYWADVKFGIHSVSSIAAKLKKENGREQYCANLALKWNLKLGGTNQVLGDDKLEFLRGGTTMIMGIDVTHPSPDSLKDTPSIAGVVASYNAKYSQWPGDIRCQESKQEMVSELEEMTKQRLELYHKKNGRLPKQILVYRDGVSEGQYPMLVKGREADQRKGKKANIGELRKIRNACKSIYPEGKGPPISIVVVGKRHKTRFFPANAKDANMSSKVQGNPLNGTVVDRGITYEFLWDFYLQAHTALQGTARPAHYVVVHDEIGMQVDQLQSATHHLCYLFGRATKAVSICPPAYYADLLCQRGRFYLWKYLNATAHDRQSGRTFDWSRSPWLGGVHANLAESMFYI